MNETDRRQLFTQNVPVSPMIIYLNKYNFMQYLIEKYFNYNPKTQRFSVKDKHNKKVFLQNLFYTEEAQLTKLLLNIKNENKKIKQIGLFYWENDRTPYAINFLNSNGLCDWLVTYYYDVKSNLSKQKEEKCYKETDLIAEMILIYTQITQNKSFISSFFEKIYKESGDVWVY